MGSGGSKKQRVVPVQPFRPSYQAEVPKASDQVEEIVPSQSWTRSSPLPAIPSERTSVRGKSPSVHSRASNKRRSSNIINGSGRRPSGML